MGSGRICNKTMKKFYKPGVLLVKQTQNDYFFDHLVILGVDTCINEYVYELLTNKGDVERKTVDWVHSYYEPPIVQQDAMG